MYAIVSGMHCAIVLDCPTSFTISFKLDSSLAEAVSCGMNDTLLEGNLVIASGKDDDSRFVLDAAGVSEGNLATVSVSLLPALDC
jgi:hypothetical protein